MDVNDKAEAILNYMTVWATLQGTTQQAMLGAPVTTTTSKILKWVESNWPVLIGAGVVIFVLKKF